MEQGSVSASSSRPCERARLGSTSALNRSVSTHPSVYGFWYATVVSTACGRSRIASAKVTGSAPP
nr:hypothetical protein [Halorubrum amylolyticum]